MAGPCRERRPPPPVLAVMPDPGRVGQLGERAPDGGPDRRRSVAVRGERRGRAFRQGTPVVPGNVSLPHLPPHSPEPDPAGQVFDHLRPNFLSNRPFPTVGDVTGAMRDARETFGTDPERIASVTKRSWARVR